MAFVHGKESRVLVAQYDVSTYFTGADVDSTTASHDVTTFQKDTIQRHAGLHDGKVSMQGLYDATVDGYLASYLGSAAGEVLTVVAGDGTSIGDHAATGVVAHVSYKVSQPVGGMVTISASLECKSSWEPDGRVLHALAAEDTTGAESSHDSGASSTNGGLATIHATAVSGTSPTLDAKVQHSANDVDWADLVSFTQLTAVGSEAKEVASGTTVNQYLRAYSTIGGSDTPTVTYLMTFARR